MNEVCAAFGLLQLKGIDAALAQRRAIDHHYRELLRDVKGITCVGDAGETVCNYAYFPILVGPEFGLGRDGLYEYLRRENIVVRRYFYPLISDFPMYRGLPSSTHANLPVAARIASQVLCLPIYPGLTASEVERVAGLVRKAGAGR
jgi:dTDP-4-amino-4,6-dideoxygalactose transaminase